MLQRVRIDMSEDHHASAARTCRALLGVHGGAADQKTVRAYRVVLLVQPFSKTSTRFAVYSDQLNDADYYRLDT